MTALTIDIDDRLITALRETAARRHTTVDAIVAERVAPLTGDDARDEGGRDEARRTFRELAETSSGRLGPGYRWDREASYEDRMFPRHERPGLRCDGEKRGGA